ncbi:hypothetical protein [Methylococcus sp. EFPC2]|uniref:hypothetical protein n=1 Tax=Methylococcus sp. EFPC2 TaxID=2812648 RepID=UPI001966D0DA|nr:hypothetical protein [Methylococcus sp. EFPC2]QSA97866.1 hypothetical protein JWZ97_03290 [Methylococcus sp. EFPC2]
MKRRDSFCRIKAVSRFCICVLLLSGCALPASREESLALEKRVAQLEREVRQFHAERSSAVADAHPSNEQDQSARLSALFSERRRLLKSYTPQHPSIKLLDLKIKELSQFGPQ